MLPEKFSLTGRLAVVTGAARGIGLAIAKVFVEAGARVVVADLDEAAGRQAAEALGPRALYRPLDVRSSAQAEALAEEFPETEILVNNAGIVRNTPALETPDEEWREIFEVNVHGVFWCSRAFGRYMVERRRGTVINIASMSGIIVNKPQPQAAYNASKAAVIQLTRSLAAEWAPFGVRVNAIAPGYIATDNTEALRNDPVRAEQILARIPAGRWGDPDDFKGAVVFLASAASNYVDGTILTVDGGWMGR